MIFYAGTALLCAAIVALFILPLGSRHAKDLNRTVVLRQLYHQRRAELQLENEIGDVAQEVAQALTEELDINLLDEHQQAPSSSDATQTTEQTPAPPSRFIVWACALALPLLAAFIYGQIGDPTADRLINGNIVLSLPADDPTLPQWRDALEERLKHRGDEEESWYLLGHLYLKEGRYPSAATAFAQTDQIKPGDPVVRTYWLQARFLANDGELDESSMRMAEELLELAPNNIAVTELLAVALFRAGDFERSAVLLTRALAGTQSPENRVQLNQLLNQVRSHLPQTASNTDMSDSNKVPDEAAAANTSVAPSITVRVSSATPVPQNATVFVVARPVGGGMPFAVERRSTNALPFEVRLDDNNSMNPQMPLSKASAIEVVVRISLSGQAMPQAGDWAWVSEPMNVAEQSHPAMLDAQLEPPR